MSYTGDLFCAFRLIVSAYFWRIYGPFIWPFMRVWSDAAQTSFNVTICGVQNIVFPSLYSNVKQDSNMKSHWWLVDSGAGRSMSSNVEDFICGVFSIYNASFSNWNLNFVAQVDDMRNRGSDKFIT